MKSLREKIVGAWGLISFEQESSEGETTHPLGKDAKGFLCYLEDGHVSVQISRSDRAESVDARLYTNRELKHNELGYLAYSGEFQLNPANGIIVHQLDISLYPEWEGGQQVRRISLEGDRLLLSSNGPVGPQKILFHLLWQRANSPQDH